MLIDYMLIICKKKIKQRNRSEEKKEREIQVICLFGWCRVCVFVWMNMNVYVQKKNIIIIIINSKNNIKMIMITFNKNIYKKKKQKY